MPGALLANTNATPRTLLNAPCASAACAPRSGPFRVVRAPYPAWHAVCTGWLALRKLLHFSERALMLAVLFTTSACASIPQHRYGVQRVRFSGVHAVDEQALRACLATIERDKVRLG